LSLLKFARVSQERCDLRPWTLPYWRKEWGRKNKLLSHLYLLYWKLSIPFICPFIHWVVDSWEFSFSSPLYILIINALSNV
jgi:hypothetical protein